MQTRIQPRLVLLTLTLSSLALAAVALAPAHIANAAKNKLRQLAPVRFANSSMLMQATTCATPSLTRARQITLDAGAEHYAIPGDFNSDGKADLAVYTTLGRIHTLLGDGAGNLTTATTLFLPTGGPRTQVGTGDFNGDGRLDVVLLSTARLELYFNNGNGALTIGNTYNINAASFVTGDFNEDGKTDVVLGLRCCPDGVAMYLSNATGFTISNPTWGASRMSAVGDFNGDGNLDVLTSDNYYPSSQVRLGNGRGQFTNGEYLFYGVQVFYFAVADFNKDGKADVLGYTAQNRNGQDETNSRKLLVLTGDGAGRFTASYPTAPLDAIRSDSVAADFTGDGFPDIATRATDIFVNNGAGGLCPAFPLVNANVNRVSAADFNGDGKADLIRQAGSLEIWTSGGGTTNTPPTIVEWVPRRLVQGFITTLLIGTVSDAETPASNLQISASNLPTGVTLTNLRSNNGSVTGDLTIGCAAPTGTYQIPLRVTDGGGLSATANWALTIDANQPPTLGTYANTTVNGASAVVTPTRSPLDDYEIREVTVRAPTYGGSITLNPQGIVTITNNNIAGTHVATVTVTDNCGLTSSATFTFTIVPVSNCDPQIPRFAPLISFPADGDVTDLATGDFNKDGRLDAVGVNFSAITLSVLYNDGRGGFFIPPTQNALASGRGTVAMGDLNRDGILDLVASNIFSNTVSVLLGKEINGFQLGVQYPAGEMPSDVKVGDFNNDGRPDVVVQSEAADRLSILLGNGSGGLGSPTNFVAPTIGAGRLAVADFNRDSRLDVAVTGANANKVSIFLGDGAGRLSLRVDYPVALASEVETGDLNRDGIPDLVVLEKRDPNYSVVVLLGRGDGTFLAATRYPVTNVMFDLSLGDINGDGVLDMLVSLATEASNLLIFSGNGNGTFRAGVPVNVGAFPGTITTGDFNGDGRLDVLARNNALGVTLLRNEGTCTTNTNTPPTLALQSTTTTQGVTGATNLTFGTVSDQQQAPDSLVFSASNVPTGVSLANLRSRNGAVTTDLIVSCTATTGTYQIPITVTDNGGLSVTANWQLTITPNKAPVLGTYANVTLTTATVQVPPSVVPSDEGSFTLSVAAPTYAGAITAFTTGVIEITNNNVAGTYQATVTATDNCGLRTSTNFSFTIPSTPTGCATPTFNAPQSYNANARPYGLTSGDFNGDGRVDLATTNLWDNTVTVLLADANGFTRQTPIAVGVLPNYIAARDLNGDNRLDLTVVNRGSDTVTILLGNGNGTFTKKGDYGVGNKSTGVMIGDFNVDGKLDLLLPNDGLGNVAVLNGNGDGSFQPLRFFFAGGSPQPGVVGDFNGDGRDDVALPNYFAGSVIFLFGSPSGSLTGTAYAGGLGGPGVEGIAKSDLNRDGKLDLVITNTTTNQLFTILGDGTGGFTSGITLATGSNYPASVVVTDFNGDGLVDVAVGGYSDNQVRVFRGLANGFDTQSPLVLPVGSEPLSLLTNDFNGDGRPDLAVANNGSGTVSVLLNGCTR